jgi:arylsulfatase A-like enzyme
MTRLLPIVFALVAAACAPDCAREGGDARPNVLLVTIDTLRADHVGAYGNRSVHTPVLDRLAAEGAVFLRTYSQTHVTVPSHLTIMSSLPLARHGAITNSSKPPGPVPGLLPAVFRDAGYHTAAFVSARHLGRGGSLGVPLGPTFEVYRSAADWWEPIPADKTTERFTRWLHGNCRAPFFAWVHYWDPHMPYAPPAPFDTMYYHDDPRATRHDSLVGVQYGWALHDTDRVRTALHRFPRETRSLKRELGVSSRLLSDLLVAPFEPPRGAERSPVREERLLSVGRRVREQVPLRPKQASWLAGIRDAAYPRALYAGEVSYVDRALGRAVAEIERLGLAPRTVVVVVGDHGESLGEHGVYFDHYGLHEPCVRVPLVVWAPGRVAPARHGELAGGIDVAPTILRLASLPVPPTMQGRDLFDDAHTSATAFAESDGLKQIMVVEGRWKLIRTLRAFHYVDAFARDEGALELYDLEADPGEQVDVARREAEVASRLAHTLDAWHEAAMRDAPPAAAPERIEGLRALGYVE